MWAMDLWTRKHVFLGVFGVRSRLRCPSRQVVVDRSVGRRVYSQGLLSPRALILGQAPRVHASTANAQCSVCICPSASEVGVSLLRCVFTRVSE